MEVEGEEEEIEEEEIAMKQLIEDTADASTGATGTSADERRQKVVKAWAPLWQNDTVIDHDSGIAMRMIDGQVEETE